jgi:hypothetical protein
MPVANRKPIFIGRCDPVATAIPATANTARDGTGTITTVFTAASPCGSLVEDVRIKATGTTTAGMVRLFYSSDGGTTWRLVDELAVTAITPSGTLASFVGTFAGPHLPLRMGAGGSHRLGISTHNAEAFVCFVQGGTLENVDTAPVAM